MSELSWVLERSFGGLGAAVSPESAAGSHNWPVGPTPPMSGAVCDALVQACSRSGGDDEPICISVLVGGAGNGKSKLASDVDRISGVYVGDVRIRKAFL